MYFRYPGLTLKKKNPLINQLRQAKVREVILEKELLKRRKRAREPSSSSRFSSNCLIQKVLAFDWCLDGE